MVSEHVLSASLGERMDGCWVNGGVCLFASHMNCEHVMGMASFPDHMVFSVALPVFFVTTGDHYVSVSAYWTQLLE